MKEGNPRRPDRTPAEETLMASYVEYLLALPHRRLVERINAILARHSRRDRRTP